MAITTFPLTPTQTAVQKQIIHFQSLSYDNIKAEYGDLTKYKSPLLCVLQGDLDTARQKYRMGFGHDLYISQAYNLALSILSSVFATPGKLYVLAKHIYVFSAHLLSKNPDEHLKEVRKYWLIRDFKELASIPKFIIFGLVVGLSKAVIALLADPCRLISRAVKNYRNPRGEYGLLRIDVQYDFLPPKEGIERPAGSKEKYQWGGNPLGVDEGWDIISPINQLETALSNLPLAESQDNHPVDHGATQKMLNSDSIQLKQLNGKDQFTWPDHCVEGSIGQQRADGLNKKPDHIVYKGMSKRVDSYSAFADNDGENPTDLTAFYKDLNVKTVIIYGLAKDFCVHSSAKDALRRGFNVIIVTNATKPVNKNADKLRELDDELRAIAKQNKKTINFLNHQHVITQVKAAAAAAKRKKK